MRFISEAYSLSKLYLIQIIVRLNREGYPLVRKKIKAREELIYRSGKKRERQVIRNI